MKIKKDRIKKSCNGCKAIAYSSCNHYVYVCSLHYKTDGEGHPKEICPKPTKNSDFVNLSMNQWRNGEANE